MRSSEEILMILRRIRESLTSRYPIQSIALFGSVARNDSTADSDIDILVEFNGSIGSRFIDLANELEQALGAPIDLVSKNGVKPKYLKSIEEDLKYV